LIQNKNNILIANIPVFFVKSVFTILFLLSVSYSFSQQDSLFQGDTIKNMLSKEILSIKDSVSENIKDTLKNDAISPDAVDQVIDYACIIILFFTGNYFRFYNRERRQQSLDRQTPEQIYEGSVMWPIAA